MTLKNTRRGSLGMLLAIWAACASSSAGIQDEQVYRKAFEFVRQSPAVHKYCRVELRLAQVSQCQLAQSDSTIFPSMVFFLHDLAVIRRESQQALRDSLAQDEIVRRRTFRSAALPVHFPAPAHPAAHLFFSSRHKNMITAEVVGPFVAHQSFSEAIQFRPRLLFLFIFDDEGNITKVLDKYLES